MLYFSHFDNLLMYTMINYCFLMLISLEILREPLFPITNPNPTVHTDVPPTAKLVSTAKNAVLL
jgi:hypothetical protein